jgi:hypothetical protein
VAKDPDQATYTYGTVVEFTATPELCWCLSHCCVDLAGSAYPDTITMDGNKTVTATFTTAPPAEYTLTIYSSPTGVTFTVDGVSRTTPWSDTYDEGASVSLVMPEIHIVGEARYYWDQWNDGEASRSRTVTMNTNITLTAHYTGPHYELTVTSSPITGVTFTINGVPKTTPYTEWLPEGSYTLVMPETHSGYVWSHWLEDGDTSRTKTITLPGTTWTGVFEAAPPPPAPPPCVGGEIILVQLDRSGGIQAPAKILCLLLGAAVALAIFVKSRKTMK